MTLFGRGNTIAQDRDDFRLSLDNLAQRVETEEAVALAATVAAGQGSYQEGYEAGRAAAGQTTNAVIEAATSKFEGKLESVRQELSGFVTTASLSNLIMMVPVAAVGGLLLFRMFSDNDGGIDERYYVPTFIVAVIAAGLLSIVSWPTLLPERGNGAKIAMVAGLMFLNTIVLTGAGLGIADVANAGEEQEQATEEPNEGGSTPGTETPSSPTEESETPVS